VQSATVLGSTSVGTVDVAVDVEVAVGVADKVSV
jgi:hypothetical protein